MYKLNLNSIPIKNNSLSSIKVTYIIKKGIGNSCMKINLFDVKEFIDLNHLKEVKSPVLFQRGNVPHPDGLVSNEIFGVTTKSRKETFAYIDLHGYFFNPHVYKAIRRMFRNIDKIVNGESFYSIDSEGKLIPSDDGDTGIDFIYENWEKINWVKSDDGDNTIGMRKERENLLSNFKKNEIFMRYQIVIPAFYRDISSNMSSGGETNDINNMYSKLIRLSTLIDNGDMFDFQFNATKYNMQCIIVDIYDYFKDKLAKKRGLIRKYLMGKNVDYCTRTVITAPVFHAEKPDDMFIDFLHTGVPISQVCSLAYPFVIHNVKQFFENEVFDRQKSKLLYDYKTDNVIDTLEIDRPEEYFSDKFIKKMIDTFIEDPGSRFNKIEVPTKDTDKKYYLTFTGKRFDASSKSELSSISHRAMTWTDLFYLACVDATKDKHVIITRYPVLDEFSEFITRIRVLSTTTTEPVIINGELYKWYPKVEPDLPYSEVATRFIDSCQFSNSYLPGIDGD